MSKEVLLKIDHFDVGYCRINYSVMIKGHKCRYCIQEEFSDTFILYRSTPDWEPDTAVTLKDYSIVEIPSGDSPLERGVRNFLKDLINQEQVACS